MNNFWHNANVEPKRNFRFLLSISAFPDAQWLAKTAERPKANVSSVPHKIINHTFHYPGRLVWNPIAITLVDPVSPVDTTRTVDDFLKNSGYKRPAGTAGQSFLNAQSALMKDKSVGALGTVWIRSLGKNAGLPGVAGKYADEWTLNNSFITGDVNFGSFDYGSEELLTISFTLQYDWATLTKSGPTGWTGTGGPG